MAPLLSNRGQSLFFTSKTLDHHPELFNQVPRSDQHCQHRLEDIATPDTTEIPWYREHPLLAIDSRQPETIEWTSLERTHNSADGSRFNKAQRKRRGLLRTPTSSCAQAINAFVVPPTMARDVRREMDWLKARVQHERDRKRGRVLNIEMSNYLFKTEERTIPEVIGPERKQITFVKEEDREYIREDRAGTSHISELQADDDLFPPSDVEELSMGGEVDALAMSWYDCNATTIHCHKSDR